MTGLFGLGRKRVAGIGASAIFLLAGCTKVVASHGAPDPVALTSYLAASSSSVAAASSSKAAAVQQAVCGKVVLWIVQASSEWESFVDAWNNDQAALSGKADSLRSTLEDISSQVKATNADASTDIGKAASDYLDAVTGLSGKFKVSGKVSADDMNSGYDRVASTGQALMTACHI